MPFLLLTTIIPCVIGLIATVGTVFWIWMVVDCATNKKISENQKVAWILIVLFTHLVGAVLYFFIGRSARPGPNVYQSYPQEQAPYNPYYQPSQQNYQAPSPNPQGYQAPPPYQQGYPAAPPSSYQGYPAATPPPYQQGYQQQSYPAGSPPPQPPRDAVPPPSSSLDYEQPQAMYPHEQEQQEDE